MKIRITPPLVLLCFAALMYVLVRVLTFGAFHFFGTKALAVALGSLGTLLIAMALFPFARAKTTLNPLHPAKKQHLFTKGVFKYTRNPIYLSMLLFLLAFALMLGNAFTMLVVAGFVSYINHFQIRYEEQASTRLFGREYLRYCNATQCWL